MSKFESNAITWFEVPTTDIHRATRFTGANFTQKRGQRHEDLTKLMRAKLKAGDLTPSLRPPVSD